MRINGWTLGLAFALGCGVPDAGDDLHEALPRVEDLTIAVPGGAAAKPSLGEPAALYVVTRRTSERLNALTTSLVGQIAAVAESPPAARGEGHAEWGPFTPPLSLLTYRLIADGGRGGVAYHLDARPKLGGAFAVILAGEARADGGAGQLTVFLDRLRALDPVAELPPEAALSVGYERDADGARIGVTLDGAHYDHVERAGGGGELAFSDGGEGRIRARWRAGGAGRAEAPGVVECWDDGFRRVFLATAGGVEGDPNACADVP